MNPFLFSNDNKRYHTLAYANHQRFGGRVWKAAIDAGFSCPNMDGTCGTGGCTFCSGGSGYFTAPPKRSVREQVEAELARIRQKEPNARAIAYFQAHTNTYAPLSTLRAAYEEALSCPGICGLSIATRPDCLPEEVVDYLAALSKETALTVELGLQTIHEETAARVHRGYALPVFLDAFSRLRAQNIRVCVHLINGLPGETRAQMLQTARLLGQLRPDGVKLQLLHLIRDTQLAKEYEMAPFALLEMDEYVGIVVDQLALFPPETVMERMTGDGDRRTLLAPLWSTHKRAVLAAIDKRQVQMNSFQGKDFVFTENARSDH